MTVRTAYALLLIALVVICLPSRSAHAQQRGGARPDHSLRLDVHGTVAWWGSFGTGVRLDIPIVPDGFLGGVDDELALSPGFDLLLLHAGNQASVAVPIAVFGVQWTFYLSRRWSVFPEVGLVTIFGNWGPYHHRHRFYEDHSDAYFAPLLGGGVRWHVDDRIAILLRASWPVGGQAGVVFLF
jgi:hypothetical protein